MTISRRAALWFALAAMAIATSGCLRRLDISWFDDRANEGQQSARYIHADFLLTEDIFGQLITDLPDEVYQRAVRLPQYFIELLFRAVHEMPRESMLVVSKQRGLEPEYTPSDLVQLDYYQPVLTLTRADAWASQHIIPDLLAMSAEARRDGITLAISSAYRSYQYQDFIYTRSVEVYGQEATNESVARAGHSQHQLGTTLDFGDINDGFGETPAGRWLAEHGWRFGFSLSYPESSQQETGYRYESWHYRYIGRAAARLERYFFFGRQQLLLEYIDHYRDDIVALLVPIESAQR